MSLLSRHFCHAQYTPPTPTRRNCRVASCRRCVHNSQLVGDSFDESEQICRQRSWQSWPSLQFHVLLSQSQVIEVGDNDDIMTSLLKKLSISIKIHVVKPLCSVSKLSTESVGSRREPVANSCSHRRRRRDATRQLRRVGGVDWALATFVEQWMFSDVKHVLACVCWCVCVRFRSMSQHESIVYIVCRQQRTVPSFVYLGTSLLQHVIVAINSFYIVYHDIHVIQRAYWPCTLTLTALKLMVTFDTDAEHLRLISWKLDLYCHIYCHIYTYPYFSRNHSERKQPSNKRTNKQTHCDQITSCGLSLSKSTMVEPW